MDKQTKYCPDCGKDTLVEVNDVHSLWQCDSCGYISKINDFLDEPLYSTFYVYGPRPEVVPNTDIPINDTFLIFNSYRQLLGSGYLREGEWLGYMRWEGEFHAGKFYAAVSLYDVHYIKANIKEGAVLIKWVDDEDVMVWAKEYYADYNINMADFTFAEMVRAFLYSNNIRR